MDRQAGESKLTGYILEPVGPDHIERIRLWRNAQMDILRQKRKLTKKGQERYFAAYWKELGTEQPSNILYAFYLEETLIGYGGLVHIDYEHDRAELSFLLDPSTHGHYREHFAAFLNLIKDVAFNGLKLNKLFTETYELPERSLHMFVLTENGFEREGHLRDHVKINGVYVNSIFHGCFNEASIR